MTNKTLRIAHLSDPHFGVVNLHPKQFFSKEWIGNFNLLLFRKHTYHIHHLSHLPSFLENLYVDYVCITGDFATTSSDEEFIKAKAFINIFKEPVLYVPGNHDCYTKQAEQEGRFFKFFSEEDSFHVHRMFKKNLGKNWWWIGLDCATSNPCFYANGKFSQEMKDQLQKYLDTIPKEDFVIIGNHFPLFSTSSSRHDLIGREELQEVLKKYQQVKLYLHGHEHSPYIIDKQNEGLPLVLNAGSCAKKPKGTFYLLDLEEKGCFVRTCAYGKANGRYFWQIIKEHFYPFT